MQDKRKPKESNAFSIFAGILYNALEVKKTLTNHRKNWLEILGK